MTRNGVDRTPYTVTDRASANVKTRKREYGLEGDIIAQNKGELAISFRKVSEQREQSKVNLS